jgi:hypothetical protein
MGMSSFETGENVNSLQYIKKLGLGLDYCKTPGMGISRFRRGENVDTL